jgi:hypothetical protein
MKIGIQLRALAIKFCQRILTNLQSGATGKRLMSLTTGIGTRGTGDFCMAIVMAIPGTERISVSGRQRPESDSFCFLRELDHMQPFLSME